ncbi:MAG: pyruvate dehydrogenase (acetyl-transferring), homodimeric type [Gammaproteobacteria bacterium]|nr:pyruvate dehydrogenase (acetyl-transferring), homodimeric type [Gammaproteobacteria bacterium]
MTNDVINNRGNDFDQLETQEWLAALESLIEREGADRAKFILDQVLQKASISGVPVATSSLRTGYRSSFTPEQQAAHPGDLAMEAKIEAINRWNSVMIVARSRRKVPGGLGGHISSCNSISTVYEAGLNHFFKGRVGDQMGDLVYFQGHSSEINYARAYLEGRLDQKHLDNFRQEIGGEGLSSYPHPWLMPTFWQFATVSLGLGQMQGVYSARFLKYLENRGLQNTQGRRVWVFCGDGEMDEPESRAALCQAANEELNNLVFVINCNLQRLDGLVRGNSKIIEEFEGLFKGCNWHVVKAVWSSEWDILFSKDKKGVLQKALDALVDGDLQNFTAHGPAYFREHFFNKDPELAALVADMTDEQLAKLGRAGHDPKKVYAALDQAVKHTQGPVVVLLQAIKGFGLAPAESKNVAHNQLEMSFEELQQFRDRFAVPVTDDQIKNLEYYHPGPESEEVRYLQARRKILGGYLPARFNEAPKLPTPSLSLFDAMLNGSGDREISSTMALARILSALLKDKEIGKFVVPMFSDEVRTFGMEGLFRQVGIYSHLGQRYTSEDKAQLSNYKEAKNGQILMEGITEAGCISSWIAAGTSYSVNNLPMIPIFTYYSMFGFQRIGDFIWAAADMRTRGFLFGGTAGRTTLDGEGLQHQDGHSLVMAAAVPTCVAYDPTFGYELAVIVHSGLKRMFADQEDIFYYVMVMNEKYAHPAMPEGVEEGIIKGMYRLRKSDAIAKLNITLLSSGAILREAQAAADLLEQDFGIAADVWSVTSFNELKRDAEKIARKQILSLDYSSKSYLAECLEQMKGPIIAATDYIRAYPDQIRAYVKTTDYHVLGTDGFGRSDTREALRSFFEVDRHYIAYTAIVALVQRGELPLEKAVEAKKKYAIDETKPHPTTV